MPLKTTAGTHGDIAKGRGSPINLEGRFEQWSRAAEEDGWFQDPEESGEKPKTIVTIERAKGIVSHNDSPDVGFSQSINPYRGCEQGCSYCQHGETPLLMANGRTKPIAEVRAGDEIYGTRFGGKFHHYKKTRVLAQWSVIKPAYRTTLEDGTTIVTSGDHRFLTERGWKFVAPASRPEQRPALTTNNSLLGTGAFAEGPLEDDDYRRGYLCGMMRGDAHCGERWIRLALCDCEALLRTQDYLYDFGIASREFLFQAAAVNRREMNAISVAGVRAMSVHQLIAWPNAPTPSWRLGFLAGIFDAEGSFSQTVLRIFNSDREIIGWATHCLGMLGFRYVMEIAPGTNKPVHVIRMLGGIREHLRFFHTVRPAITRKLDIEGQAIKCDAKLRVVSVEPLGKAMRLYDIQTESEDFIANGVVSHNCFARPTHAYLGLSPGLDFETRLFAKTNAAELWREALAKPGYKCELMVIGVNTDAYQPIEREYRITRSLVELAAETKHPIGLITKSALIERDIDLLAPMAADNLVSVTLSITTLKNEISRYMEPRAAAPARRLLAVERLAKAGIPVNVNVGPVVPFLTDSELEPILEAAANAGAKTAGYHLVRLPWEVKDIFKAWLEARFPLKAAHIMSRLHEMRGGRDNDPNFGSRMSGEGLFAQLLGQRFEKACRRFHLNEGPDRELDCSLFRPPSMHGQGTLF